MSHRLTRTSSVIVAAACAALALSSCSGGGDDATDSGATADPQGKDLVVATGSQFPPMEYIDTDTKKLTGFDIDLGHALAKEMGVKLQFQQLSYNQFLSSLKTGRVNMILGGMGDTVERQDQATFVDYLGTGTQLFTSVQVKKDKGINALADLCGQPVAASQNSNYKTYIDEWSKKNCEGKGKPAIKVIDTDGSPAARLQLKQGRAVAVAQTKETVSYQMKTEPGAYALVGGPLNSEFYGIGLAPKDKERQQAVVKALNALIKDGTYGKIAKKWGVDGQAVKEATVNLKPTEEAQ